MHPKLSEIIGLLELEVIEKNLFRGQNESSGGRLFGGQVLAQGLRAASMTVVPERLPHSLHGYFLRPGSSELPVLYEVDRIRDGRSFTTRRVSAMQRGEAIFNMMVSFQVHEESEEHHEAPPAYPRPEALRDDVLIARDLGPDHPEVMPWTVRERAFEFRSVSPLGSPPPSVAAKASWMRARVDELPSGLPLHLCLLAYASDMSLMSTCLVSHQKDLPRSRIQGASLDHALWFHRPFRVDQWLLYDRDSPQLGGSLGYNRGTFYDLQGRPVASAMQQALVRVRNRQI